MARPSVIAHRGASDQAPENTLAAFRRAAALGATAIETDLRVTRDGKFVLLHDARVNRTTDGRGRVAAMTLDAVRRLDAGSWFGKEFARERVPTLEEGLALAAQLHLGVYLELKTPHQGSLPLLLARVMRYARRLERVVLLSFDSASLALARAIEPRIETALLVARAGRAVGPARRAAARLLAPFYRRVSRRLVRRAHGAGLGVIAWTVNERSGMRRMLALGVDGIMTNRPDCLIEEIGHAPSRPADSQAGFNSGEGRTKGRSRGGHRRNA